MITKEKLIDKIEDIQDENWNKFIGSNECQLHTRLEIADLLVEILEEQGEKKFNEGYEECLQDGKIRNQLKGIDLNKLDKKIDDALDKETDESLTKWLTDKRKKQPKEIEEPHCDDCGASGDDLAYIEQYANGEEYKCKECEKIFIHLFPTPDN